MSRFDIPEIPHEAVVRAKMKMRKVWQREDLDLKDPAVFIDWSEEEPAEKKGSGYSQAPAAVTLSLNHSAAQNPKRMVEDPEYDLSVQMANVRRAVERLTAGEGFCNLPVLNLVHFGTAPIATAFGAQMVLRDGMQPAFEPAVHTAQQALALRKPDLWRAGVLPKIIERIEYYNEMTQGKIPVTISDNAGPWSIATSIWHYEDMLEALYTAPEAVHYLLRLVTECIIEVNCIQMEVARNSWGKADTVGGIYIPHGCLVGDDVMVTVSPRQWEEFFKPYNEILSREYGGIGYHCCRRHDWQFDGMVKTQGFVSLDADPVWNDLDQIERALAGRGVWKQMVEDWDVIRRLRGKVAFYILVRGDTKAAALQKYMDLKEFLRAGCP